MTLEVFKVHEVSWMIPQALYEALKDLQENLKGPTLAPKWGSVEALACHFLTVAVREAHKELRAKQRAERLVLLPEETRP